MLRNEGVGFERWYLRLDEAAQVDDLVAVVVGDDLDLGFLLWLGMRRLLCRGFGHAELLACWIFMSLSS